jgi:hypothetical protein
LARLAKADVCPSREHLVNHTAFKPYHETGHIALVGSGAAEPDKHRFNLLGRIR